MKNRETLLAFASRQIWPHVLSVLHCRPKRLILFHSGAAKESQEPAERLSRFFISTSLLSKDKIILVPVPDDSFGKLIEAIASEAERLLLDEENSLMNLTGGNKLMAMAAAEWCRLAGVPCFYLERDGRVFPFEIRSNDLLPQPVFKLDPHLTRDVEPLELLACQVSASEIASSGERITLSSIGRELEDRDVQEVIDSGRGLGPITHCLSVEGKCRKEKEGDHLEYATALALLKLGVPVVLRGVELFSRKTRFISESSDARLRETEFDLIFNWQGKLWLVDCKDRVASKLRLSKLRDFLEELGAKQTAIDSQVEHLEEQLQKIESNPLRDDLLFASEISGLLGRALCVRRDADLPDGAREFAESRHIPVIEKARLVEGLKTQLYPDLGASLDQLKSLQKLNRKQTSSDACSS